MTTITTPSNLPPILILPRTTIQPTFLDVLNDIKQGLHAVEDTWTSIYKEGSKSVHGRIRINEFENAQGIRNGEVELVGREGVIAHQLSNTSFSISSPPLSVPPTTVSFPSSTPYSLRLGIDTFDISPDGTQFLVGGKDGILRIGDMKTGKARELRGHVGDMRDVKFFPSGAVALTASIDMSLRVFSLADATNLRTLLGHTGTITSTHIHLKGKTVLSSSMDGSVRVWDVGKEEIIKVIRFSLPITGMVIGSSAVTMEVEDNDESLVGKIAILGHSNGTASIYSFTSSDLSSTSTNSASNSVIRTLRSGTSSPITAIAYDELAGLVLLGSREGNISLFDLKKPIALAEEDGLLPIGRFRRSDSSITSIHFCTTSTILIGSADGLPYRLNLSILPEVTEGGEGIKAVVVEEFAGMDCDSVIIKNGNVEGEVWVGGQDGGLRRYLSKLEL